MSNPIFNTGAFPDQFNEQKRERRRFYMNSDSGTVSEDRRQDKTYAQQHGMPKGQAESLERSYGMQDAAYSEGAPMTFDDVIRKTAISFVVVLLGAASR
ncbi:hypothetical protein [Nesterenkonia pannonica]|uniref:hypothetical protein n=1 Tax=Nesterenkonia pannonica TaxID=1548602 RepID=UPI00216417C6|nr:hypothetical protein [Nesterenkonia pannonica]